MRLSLTRIAVALSALGATWAQNSTTSSASSTTQPTNQTVLTTVITSYISQPSGRSSAMPLTLTLTLNSTSPSVVNETIANATANANSTEWTEGDDWIPFDIIIDPAYGVLGALLILSGIPLAVLGGKNRWSSLAITTGYALMVFTLVMILALGVSPALQPPSPKPPTQLLRGLYLLACVLSAFVGAGLGVFLYKLAKYWVNAAGGFAFAWYILALRPGGTIENVIGRWGLIGGMVVGGFIAGLPNRLNPYLVLVSTAWIGATAFILGIDCFTRAGLKEFYVYNLGFWNLFPKLNGMKYPLTQTMAIELGILAAVFLIGAAIQFRILNILQKRMKQMQDEEEARVDAEEVGKAAERFKNLEAEHAEWEEKYGPSSQKPSNPAADLPDLPFGTDRFASTHSLLSYEPVNPASPTTDTFRNKRDIDSTPAEELVGESPLDEQIKLLEEVKKARLEVRSSLDRLRSTPSLNSRSGTPAGLHSRQNSNASSNMLGRPVSILQRASPTSPGFPLEPLLAPPKTEWEQYVSSRNIVSPAPTSAPLYDGTDIPLRERRSSSQTMPLARPTSNYDLARPISNYDLRRPTSQYDLGRTESYAPGTIVGSAAGAKYTAVTPGHDGPIPRAMTYEELADRHRKRITKLQDPISSKMNEEIQLAAAKEKWEKQKELERKVMRRREAEKMQLVKEREAEAAELGREAHKDTRAKREVMQSTDEWRRSVAGNLDTQVRYGSTNRRQSSHFAN